MNKENKLIFSPENFPPSFLFIEITRECNLTCKQCHMWMSKDDNECALTTKDKIHLIEEFHNLCPDGTVVFTGGETMKKTPEFFSLSLKCRDLGLHSAANTNATFIENEFIAEKLIRCGPNYIVVSLDSHIEEQHDFLRGKKGTYRKAVDALVLLVKTKRSIDNSNGTRIMVNCIISELNYRDLHTFICFLKALGIGGVTFQIISRTFFNQKETDYVFDELLPKDKAEFKLSMDKIISEFKDDQFVCTSKNDFEWMKIYIENPDFLGEPVCISHEKNMMVDIYGEVQLCFGMRQLLNGKCLGTVRDKSLKELWTSSLASDARLIMAQCRKNCGMLNCHRRNLR